MVSRELDAKGMWQWKEGLGSDPALFEGLTVYLKNLGQEESDGKISSFDCMSKIESIIPGWQVTRPDQDEEQGIQTKTP